MKFSTTHLGLVSIPAGPITQPAVVTPSSNRSEQFFKTSRINRPTVNSLMHLYGPWILDACLLQIKDRYSRSSTTNEGKFN
jgi:hypothetical protein